MSNAAITNDPEARSTANTVKKKTQDFPQLDRDAAPARGQSKAQAAPEFAELARRIAEIGWGVCELEIKDGKPKFLRLLRQDFKLD